MTSKNKDFKQMIAQLTPKSQAYLLSLANIAYMAENAKEEEIREQFKSNQQTV